jgi:hypothetical protein
MTVSAMEVTSHCHSCYLTSQNTRKLSINLKKVILHIEHRLRVFENRVLRRIFGPKRDEVTGGWRKLHNEELHGLYSSPSIVRVIKARRMRWAGHVARMGEVRGAYNILVGRSEGRRPLGRPRRRWEDNIKMDLRGIGLGCGLDSLGSG